MGIKEQILSKIPAWVGFLLLILFGLGFVIFGILGTMGVLNLAYSTMLSAFVFGPMCIIIGAFSWIVGGTSRIEGRVGTVGVLVSLADLPWWGYLVDGVVLVTGLVVFLVLE